MNFNSKLSEEQTYSDEKVSYTFISVDYRHICEFSKGFVIKSN